MAGEPPPPALEPGQRSSREPLERAHRPLVPIESDDFAVRSSVVSFWGPHYSDLCWFRRELYVLMREDHVILRVDPRLHRVLAEYDFRAMEFSDEYRYHRLYPFVGVMEGLAVDQDYFWLVTDNNGLSRERHPNDTRPTLFVCPRPDGKQAVPMGTGSAGPGKWK